MEKILETLKSERIDDSSYRSPAESTCISNLIAFLLFLANDVDNAVEEINKVLSSPNNDTNIVALANMAVIKWEIGDRMEGETIIERLQELSEQGNFEDKVIDAKAEMAYCYSRMGMSFASRAEDIFEEVVEARPHEYTWKYGLAKILRRFTQSTYILFFRISFELASQKSLRAFDLLLEIKNSRAPGGERAQALTELGLLLQLKWNKQFSRLVDRAEEERITAQQCFEEAVELAPEDPYVLTHVGNFYNYAKQLDKSRQLLQRAIEIRPTTTSYHLSWEDTCTHVNYPKS
ncbi:hypothetical protein C0Q70_02853 [Pomacea canaliculata]|uniref:Uncharacterized protein n=2 Tax=Pomacea canaliculata TaxID=400727 RepID=A0A2T7PR31_POMCA|nr:hypothetical protein C0Q70_02853 [Pomacea canaliculata]